MHERQQARQQQQVAAARGGRGAGAGGAVDAWLAVGGVVGRNDDSS
jgi:hypothetical protein